jgi:hypothetical protein
LYEQQAKTSKDAVHGSQIDRRRLTEPDSLHRRGMVMYIPMIFFTIIIERRVISAEEREARCRQQQAIAEWEEQRMRQASQFPEYCTRL